MAFPEKAFSGLRSVGQLDINLQRRRDAPGENDLCKSPRSGGNMANTRDSKVARVGWLITQYKVRLEKQQVV